MDPSPFLLLTCVDKAKTEAHYVAALRATGWTGPVRLHAPEDGAVSLDGCAGLLVTGGDDIHPAAWDASEPVHPMADPDRGRDALELPAVRAAWARRLPIFGICRGLQVLNVALGGSLHQDVPTHFECPRDRHQHGGASLGPEIWHEVEVAPGSRIREVCGASRFPVNSRHHQAVRKLGAGLVPVAWHPETAKDGETLVEAMEAAEPDRWVVGVQWHPENLVAFEGPAGEAARQLFGAFLEAAGGENAPDRG